MYGLTGSPLMIVQKKLENQQTTKKVAQVSKASTNRKFHPKQRVQQRPNNKAISSSPNGTEKQLELKNDWQLLSGVPSCRRAPGVIKSTCNPAVQKDDVLSSTLNLSLTKLRKSSKYATLYINREETETSYRNSIGVPLPVVQLRKRNRPLKVTLAQHVTKKHMCCFKNRSSCPEN
ncbi:hypothetical protein NPIL_425611 [Nephila pilipes]|uniref:Uncharacterized protein n=1 Tax=Nephila pilipes TaxID=299642 RepID=A0A8X6Q9Q4_NEPPI|nr:hypothetical protein NPIL_425611 [Nephila pilipes]